MNYGIKKKEGRIHIESSPAGSHSGEDLVFNEGFPRSDSRNVDVYG